MLLVVEFFITVFLLVLAYYKYSFNHWSKLNVPYVLPTLPWGNYPNPILRKENWGEVAIRMYHDMKKKGHKYFGIYLFSQPCLVPTDPKYVRLFLAKEFTHFNFRIFYYNVIDDPVSAHLISLNGDKWRKLRTKMTPIFTTGKIKTVFKVFVECEKVLEQTLSHHSEKGTAFDVKDMFASFSSDVIVNCAFGLEVDMFRKNEFSKHTKKAMNFDMARCIVMYLGAAFPQFCRMLGFRQIAKSSGDFFIEVVANTVNYREKNSFIRNDFLQLLINLRDQKRKDGEDFTIGEITAQCFIFFLAGFETSAATMTFALYEIAANPEVYEKLSQEVRTVLAKHNGEVSYEAIKEMSYLEQVVLGEEKFLTDKDHNVVCRNVAFACPGLFSFENVYQRLLLRRW